MLIGPAKFLLYVENKPDGRVPPPGKKNYEILNILSERLPSKIISEQNKNKTPSAYTFIHSFFLLFGGRCILFYSEKSFTSIKTLLMTPESGSILFEQR